MATAFGLNECKITFIWDSYGRDNFQMISLILKRLPQEKHKPFITAFGIGGYTWVTLPDIQNRLRKF